MENLVVFIGSCGAVCLALGALGAIEWLIVKIWG